MDAGSVVNSERQPPGQLQGSVSCSVCLEPVDDGGERSVAKLKCGHHFHLDCIGSAFNAKGTMQCPNCRHVEDGQWLYANGCRQQDFMLEDVINADDDVYAGVSEIIFPRGEMLFGHLQWCPYQTSYPQLSVSVEEMDHPPAGYSDLIVNVLVGEHTSNINPSHPCPYMQGQGHRFSRHLSMPEESVAALDLSLGSQHAPPNVGDVNAGQFFSMPQGGRWARPPLATVTTPNGIGSIENGPSPSMHPHHRFRWPPQDIDRSTFTGSHFPVQYGHNGLRQGPGEGGTGHMAVHGSLSHQQNHNLQQGGTAQQPPPLARFSGSGGRNRRSRVRGIPNGRGVQSSAEGMVMHGPNHRGGFGTSAGQDLSMGGMDPLVHMDGMAFAPRRRDGSVLSQHPPLLHGGYQMHDPQAHVGLRTPEGPFLNQFQGSPFPAFPTFLHEPQADIGSLQPHLRH